MNDCGKRGEEAAEKYLLGNGYQILERNYYTRYGEIDRIARKGEILAFVEVKARGSGMLERPGAAVSLRKQEKLIRAAETYLLACPCDLQPRFDVIEVYVETSAPFAVQRVEHLENAFDRSRP